jgi:putative ABC transport system permease protein
LVPALSASRQDLRSAIAHGARSGEAPGGRRWRAALVVGEFALTCLLLVGASLMLRTLGNLYRADPGFRTEHLIAFNLDLPSTTYGQPNQRRPFIERTLSQLATLPGVNRVSLASPLPLSGGGNQNTYYVEGTPVPGAGQAPSTERFQVDGGYFTTLGIALVTGRTFSTQDQETSPRTVIIDTMFAEKNFPHQNPIGKRLAFGSGPPAKDSDWMQIVGVVAHIQNYGVRDATREQAYLACTQSVPSDLTFIVRTERDPAALYTTLRAEMHKISGELPIYGLRTMDEMFESTVSTERLTVLLLGVFSSLALLLAGVGLYGVLNYTVGQRTHEIGIRMALGATSHSVIDLVVRHGLRLAGLGLLLGLGSALGLTSLLRNMLYEVSPFDPLSFAAVTFVLTAIGAFACWLPARRATRVDPIDALRAE